MAADSQIDLLSAHPDQFAAPQTLRMRERVCVCMS